MSPNPPGGSKADPNIDAIATELEAMQTIASVLAGIRDPQTRERIVRWTYDRFMKSAPETAPPVPQVPSTNPDLPVEYPLDPDDATALSVEGLYELFDGPPASPAAAPARLTQGGQETTVEPLFREEDLIDPTLTPTDFVELELAEPAAAIPPANAVDATASPAAAPAETDRGLREEPALDTLVKGFASELQRLAIEWQTT